MKNFWSIVLVSMFCSACGSSTKQQSDELYSRHLQRKVPLTIFSTKIPDNLADFNLLIMNDGQDLKKIPLQKILDSLQKNDLIKPLLIVGVGANDRWEEFGVAGKPDRDGRGSKADHYEDFITNELLPYIKKKAGVRKFASVAIAGLSMSGLLSFDYAWNHPDKIDIVGVFSGSFWWRDKEPDDSGYSAVNSRIMYQKLLDSRKKPKLRYWFSAGTNEVKYDSDGDGITDMVDDTEDIIAFLRKRLGEQVMDKIKYTKVEGGTHDWEQWGPLYPSFLVWAFGEK